MHGPAIGEARDDRYDLTAWTCGAYISDGAQPMYGKVHGQCPWALLEAH